MSDRTSSPSSASPSPLPLLCNSLDDATPWIIQKYGGTSVGKFLDNIGAIAESYLPEHRLAIVCSARSGTTKALGTTNLLLQASREALRPPPPPPSSQSAFSNAGSIGGNASGSQTPMFPKRVGSGYFNGNEMKMTPGSGSGSGSGTTSSSAVQQQQGQGMSSSISSLRDLKLNNGSRSSSPSPFQSSTFQSPSSSQTLPNNSSTTPTANSVMENNQQPHEQTVDLLKKDHLDAARKAVKDEELLMELEGEIVRDCEGLKSFLSAAQIIDEISPRSQDSIVGIGERLACKIVAAALRDRGIDSELVCLDNIIDATLSNLDDIPASTTGDQGVAQLDQSFYDILSQRLGDRIQACGHRVPVITGYFGVVPGSLLNQIGRGYTDLCAALCAVGINASELQVWKEVDGIFTADPRKVPTARLVPVITPDEAAELTYYGSEVIHPFTMEQVIRARIPIRIKNVENPKGQGTIIYPQQSPNEDDGNSSPTRPSSSHSAASLNPNQIVKLPTAVTIKDNIIILNIHSNRKTISHGFLARIFGTLDRAGVVVDLISTSEVHVSMAMQDFMNKKQLDRLVKDLEKIGHITISKDMAILSLVGRQMRHMIGTAGKMFATLAEGKINIEMISQGASEINISCVIDNKDSIKALNLIHQSCLTSAAANNILGDHVPPQPTMSYRYDHYQNATDVIVSVYKKQVKIEDVSLVVKENSVKLNVAGEQILSLDPLAAPIIPDKVRHKVYGTKVEIYLPKANQGLNWSSLTTSASAAASAPPLTMASIIPSSSQIPINQNIPVAKPVSQRKDWGKIVADEQGEEKKEDDINAFFQQIYANSDPDVRRAMIKSYTESNGTTLSTNWTDVGQKTVETMPPEGVEVSKRH